MSTGKPRITRITSKILRAWHACYGDEKIQKLMHPHESVTLLQVLDSNILPEDKIWVASRALSPKDARLFACWCAERITPTTEQAVETIRVAREYAYGRATDEDLYTANQASYWAADLASYRAAYWASYMAASQPAERAAERAANRASYWASYWASYEAAEREAHVKRLRKHVTGEEPLV